MRSLLDVGMIYWNYIVIKLAEKKNRYEIYLGTQAQVCQAKDVVNDR